MSIVLAPLLALASLLQTPAPQSATSASAPRPLFVPELRVIHELVGEAAGDQFGWIGRNVGDCDGDHVDDFVLTAPTRNVNGPGAGRAYVYSSKSGKLLFTCDGKPGDLLGWGSEGAGDVNGDGAADVIIGAPGAHGGRGSALVYSGKDGKVLFTFEGEKAGDGFGRKVSGAGDIDGDGHADLLVGADLCDSIDDDAGRAYLYSGADGQLVLTLDGENRGDKFGVALCGQTIVKGKDASGKERETLIAIGAADAGAQKGGRVYVFLYAKGEIELSYTIEADATGVAVGAMFLSILGDVDGDGYPDVYASDWQNNASGPSSGRIYVYSGRANKCLLTLTGEKPGDGFGIGTADVGDVNGDGRADLLIGAWQSPEGAPSGGKCTLHSGKDGALLGSWICTQANETFGFDTTGLGDVDGDGAIDYLITNAWSGVQGVKSGRAFVVAGAKPGAAPSAKK